MCIRDRGSTLTNLVASQPQCVTIVISQILADTTYIYIVLTGALQDVYKRQA